MEESGKCEVCQKLASQRCAGCHSVFYCSKDHQKQAWKEHKKNCRPFEICEDEILGRHLLAIKDIKEGDIVLQEEPLLKGPLQTTVPVCLGCGNAINPQNFIRCSECGWPLCSKKCEHSLNHIPECYYTVKRGEKISVNVFDLPHPAYQCITTLRCLYQKKFAPDIWEKLNKMESHDEERKKSGRLEEEKMYIVKFIREFFELKNEFTEEEILKVCGIIMVNGHEVPLTTPPYVTILPLTSLLEHNCKSNCYKTVTNQGKMLVIAGVPIKKGEHLSICYTDAFWPTFNRKRHLMETKFFQCTCDRCMDVTEYGTYFSGVKCQTGDCDGLLLPESFLVEGLPWTCRKCKNELSSTKVDDIMERVGKDLAAMEKGNLEKCKQFLEYYEKLLPENHFYMVDVKLALIQLISFGVKTQENVPNDDLELLIKISRHMVQLLQIISPAEKRVKGSFLFEFHTALTERARRQATAGLIKNQELLEVVLESKSFLVAAVDCLKHEPSIFPEGRLYKQAKENLEKIEGLLVTLAERAESAE